MTIERLLRGIAGFFIIVSLILSVYHSQDWLWFTGFVGLNLFQSSFSNWCPVMSILKKFGYKNEGASAGTTA